MKEMPALGAESPQCPTQALSWLPAQAARSTVSHLDVRELAQVRVHGQQRLVHQFLVVIHPEQVIVLKEKAAHEHRAASRPACSSRLPGTLAASSRPITSRLGGFSKPQFLHL